MPDQGAVSVTILKLVEVFGYALTEFLKYVVENSEEKVIIIAALFLTKCYIC
jgi:hypothetical protein